MHFLKNPLNDASDEQLMAAIQNGNSSSFEELYNRYSKRLFIYFYRMLGSEEKAQDFLHDIFLKIIEHPKAFDTKRTFSNWIFSIAANMCKNEYRSREIRRNAQQNGRVTETAIQLNAEAKTEDEIDRIQFKKRLIKEVQELDADQRNVFLLRFQENLSIKEIGKILNCPEGTVKSRLFYLTRRLAIKLKDFDPSEEKVGNHGK